MKVKTRDKRRTNRHSGSTKDHGRGVPWLTSVKPVPRNRLAPGVVVWARVEFMDGTGDKVRPAVVESLTGREVRVRPATTSPRRHRLPHGYVEVADLEEAGLNRPTAVSIVSVLVDRMAVLSIAGELAPEDFDPILDHGRSEDVRVAG